MNKGNHRILLLAVSNQKHSAELARILAHTGWQTHFVTSIADATQALQKLPISVVLCEDRLPDGGWLDLMRETERLCPQPQTIVLAAQPDSKLWAEVLNCGGYDLLAIPLEARELYDVVPMAWRQCGATSQKKPVATGRNSERELADVC